MTTLTHEPEMLSDYQRPPEPLLSILGGPYLAFKVLGEATIESSLTRRAERLQEEIDTIALNTTLSTHSPSTTTTTTTTTTTREEAIISNETSDHQEHHHGYGYENSNDQDATRLFLEQVCKDIDNILDVNNVLDVHDNNESTRYRQ